MPTSLNGINATIFFMCGANLTYPARDGFYGDFLNNSGLNALGVIAGGGRITALDGEQFPMNWLPMGTNMSVFKGCDVENAFMFPISRYYPYDKALFNTGVKFASLFFGADMGRAKMSSDSPPQLAGGGISTMEAPGPVIVVDREGNFCTVVERVSNASYQICAQETFLPDPDPSVPEGPQTSS